MASGFGTTRIAGFGIVSRIGDMLSGLLAVLLGVMIFKYGGLRRHDCKIMRIQQHTRYGVAEKTAAPRCSAQIGKCY